MRAPVVTSNYVLQVKNPDSTGGLTDWNYMGVPFSRQDGLDRVEDCRRRAAEDGSHKEFRLMECVIVTSHGEWTEVTS